MLGESILVPIFNRFSRRPPVDQGARREGLLFGHTRDVHGAHVPVRMPPAARAEHVFVIGKTGTGKTHLLQTLIDQHIERGDGFIFFDFHGDSIDAVLRMATRHPTAAERLVLLDPTDHDTSPGLNPLELQNSEDAEAFRRVSELAAILRARWNVDAFGPRSEELLRNVLYTLAVNNLTLVQAPTLLTSFGFRHGLTSNLPSTDIRAYWRDRFEILSEPMKAMLREPLLNKITSFLVEPSSRHLLGQAKSTVNLGAAMQQGAFVLVNLSKGVLRENAHTLANLIFAKLQFEVFGRTRLAPDRRRFFSIIVDEVQNLAENDLITLLTEGRKFGVGLITANQYWEQLPKTLRGALLAAGSLVAFRVSHADASGLASELSTTARNRFLEMLTTLPRGQAAARIGAASPVQIVVPPMAPLPGSAQTEATALRALSLRKYARKRSDIERDIAASDRSPVVGGPTSNNAIHENTNEGQHEW